MRNTTVLVSGASVAGPALAYWLSRYGFDVTVVERAPALRPGGQAIDFKGRVQRTVLERMGVFTDIERRSTGATDMVLVDSAGKPRARISGDFTGGDVEILRGDLAEIFYKRTAGQCSYIFGDSITALRETDHDVHVEFEHGPARRFDLVFGADGIHSRVRALVFGPEQDFVHHRGYHYCVAGSAPAADRDEGPRRRVCYGHNAPGRLAIYGGPKAQQMYMFAAPELDYARDDEAAQRRILTEMFAEVGWKVPAMLAELKQCPDFYLDALAQVRMGTYVSGRVALVGDSAYGNTLAGFGTGFAVVGAYVLAGELAAADGDHTVAFPRYDEVMRRYTKISGNSNPGRFLAPKTAYGIRLRDWFLGSRLFAAMDRYAADAKDNIDLRDYPALLSR
ncbi:FAD-dependent monooxygenase [Nocardia donostiensis]|uniref:FAD-dependent oxidoreductase n=1 Tax=Nocardia donostiensis TaxID=1538463 RepID=A0A1V2TM69_9NOCA|nr:FAD-dependent monooxygenase [Nocardia donostiensis]ONM50595.1 FAD-dependent oxidoreductase [Nocardia donostiensis]OQS17172.1 FAD-dependent oxidoreductase [Nocardia donostiensis]OQS20761.1 FAD-dependent oxidoreductase [Nocardia donostiensis]